MSDTRNETAAEVEEAQNQLAHMVMTDGLKVAVSLAIPDMEMADACLSGAFTLVRRHAQSDMEAIEVLVRCLNNAINWPPEPARH